MDAGLGGFDLVRIPIAYFYYLNIDRTKNITAKDTYKISPAAIDTLDKLVQMARTYNLHMSINLHRAPSYCIGAGFSELFNLWKDAAAQDAFYYHWNMWAKRYKNLSNKLVSFDLVNEPKLREDMNDQHSPEDVYRKVAIGAREGLLPTLDRPG